MRRPPIVHAAMPETERSSAHLGRTKAFCLVWAHDLYVREFGVAQGVRYMPNSVGCGNCWARWKRTPWRKRQVTDARAI